MDDTTLDLLAVAVPVILAAAVALALGLGTAALGAWLLLELLAVLVLYGGAAMTTRPEPDVRARDRVGPPGPVDRLGARFDAATRLSLPLGPTIRPLNLRFVVPSLLLFAVPVVGAGGALLVEGASLGGRRGRGGVTVTAISGALSVLERPAVAAVGALLVVGQAVRFYRCHVATGRLEDWTTHMLLDALGSYVFVSTLGAIPVFLAVVAALVAVGAAGPALVGETAARTLWMALAVATVLGAKLGLEYSRVHGERAPPGTATGFAANFSPTPPPTADGPDA